MRLIAFLVFAGCLCGCASKNKESENLSDHSLPVSEQMPDGIISTLSQVRTSMITNSPGYEEGYGYKIVQNASGITVLKMNKEFAKFSQDISLKNVEEVSIKFRAKKNSTAPTNALVGVRLIVGKEHIFHLKKDPHHFSSTNTWENVEYNFDSMEFITKQLDYPTATVHIYVSAIKSESIDVDKIVVEVKNRTSSSTLLGQRPILKATSFCQAGHE